MKQTNIQMQIRTQIKLYNYGTKSGYKILQLRDMYCSQNWISTFIACNYFLHCFSCNSQWTIEVQISWEKSKSPNLYLCPFSFKDNINKPTIFLRLQRNYPLFASGLLFTYLHLLTGKEELFMLRKVILSWCITKTQLPLEDTFITLGSWAILLASWFRDITNHTSHTFRMYWLDHSRGILIVKVLLPIVLYPTVFVLCFFF